MSQFEPPIAFTVPNSFTCSTAGRVERLRHHHDADQDAEEHRDAHVHAEAGRDAPE